MPEIMFIRVVLPLPFSPSRERICPRSRVRSMASLATTFPNRLVMCLSSIAWTVSKAVILSSASGASEAVLLAFHEIIIADFFPPANEKTGFSGGKPPVLPPEKPGSRPGRAGSHGQERDNAYSSVMPSMT